MQTKASTRLRADLARMLAKWHGSNGKPTPLVKRGDANADVTHLQGDETFCLCGLALLAVEFDTVRLSDLLVASPTTWSRRATGWRRSPSPRSCRSPTSS